MEDYRVMLEQYQVLNDCYDSRVKDMSVVYLPKPLGYTKDSKNGLRRYNDYKQRAKWYDYFKQTVNSLTGIITRRPAIIVLPKSMEYLLTDANSDRETLMSVLTEVYREQIKIGRLALVADLNDNGTFNIQLIKATDIVSWEESTDNGKAEFLSFVYRANRSVYRLWLNDDGKYQVDKYSEEEYAKAKGDFTNIKTESSTLPMYKQKTIGYIPVTFVNISNTNSRMEISFLYDQANLCIGLYQIDADHSNLIYRQSFNLLFGKGIDSDEQKKLIDVDGAYIVENSDADLKYVGVNGVGLAEIRQEKEALKREIQSYGISVFDKAGVESEGALEMRIRSNTDKLRSISLTGASGLQYILNCIANWTGETGNILVLPNQDFMTNNNKIEDLERMSRLYQLGVITEQDYYGFQYRNGYTQLSESEWKSKLKPVIGKGGLDA